MKTQKEMIELLAESEMVTSMKIYALDVDLKAWIFNRSQDGDNVLDFLALAIDQMGKEDGINLIDEILTELSNTEEELILMDEAIPESIRKSVNFRNLLRKDILDTIVEKGMGLVDRDILDVSSAEVLAELDDINEEPMTQLKEGNITLELYFINNDIIFIETNPKYPEKQVWGLDSNTYDWFIIDGKELDAQVPEDTSNQDAIDWQTDITTALEYALGQIDYLYNLHPIKIRDRIRYTTKTSMERLVKALKIHQLNSKFIEMFQLKIIGMELTLKDNQNFS